MLINSIRKKISRIIINFPSILSGLYRFVFRIVPIEEISANRMSICRSNICGSYDKDGTSELSIGNGGGESCAICGCILQVKTRCRRCKCGQTENGKEDLWKTKK